MNRFLEKLNLAGVIVLAGLCVFQWRMNRDANVAAVRAQTIQQKQNLQIIEQEKEMAGQKSDLESFRAQLMASKSAEKELRTKLADAEKSNVQLGAEAEALRGSLTNWVVAVSERDDQLKRASVELKGLVEARDAAIDKYNALAKTHNQLVADVNRTATNSVVAAGK